MIARRHCEIVECFAASSELSADLRFDQLMDFLELLANDATHRSLPEIDDAELLAAVEGHLAIVLSEKRKAG